MFKYTLIEATAEYVYVTYLSAQFKNAFLLELSVLLDKILQYILTNTYSFFSQYKERVL